MTGWLRACPSLWLSLLAVFGSAAAFVQIERGTGSIALSLLYVAHNLMVAGVLAAAVFLVARRPLASILAGLAIVFLIWFASRLKVSSMDIPALASDLPRILDTWDVVVEFGWPALWAAGVALAAILAIAVFERPHTPGRRGVFVVSSAAAALVAGSVWIQSQIPTDDDDVVTNNGPKVAIFVRSIYASPDFRDASFPALAPYCCFRDARRPSLRFAGTVRPHIVVVLQESTFPPHHLSGVSRVSNRLLDGAAPLLVDVVGGGTWVEEYALLHGVPPSVYGRDFMQVLWLGREHGLQGRLVPLLAGEGYRSLAILPYEGWKLGNSEAMQRSLGFERVDDCGAISGCELGGAWALVPDAALYEHALDAMRSSPEPMLVYLATMRQHSPHVPGYPKSAYRDQILAEYLRRLDMSAREADDFLSRTRDLDRPVIVLMFGDHIATDVHAAFGDGEFRVDRRRTFFAFYDPEGRPVAAELMREFPEVEAPSTAYLDALLLRFAGLEGDYIDRKLEMMRACGGKFCSAQKQAASLGEPPEG